MKLFILLVVIVFAQFVIPADAQAYLDPGTGSVVLQMTVAVLLGALFTLKMYWQRVKSFVARLFGKTAEKD